ncbi:MAG: translocation/assembly module TamB, partial [Bacteroidota bacterium]
MLLFIILVLVLSIPSVQTKLGRYVTGRLNKDFNTDINIGKVGLQFNGDVELKEILIRDHHQDTLISIQELNTSIISFRNVINNKLNFGDIDIEELYFSMKTYEGEEDSSLDIFVASFDDDQPRTEPSDFLFSSSDITIDGGNFIIRDENLERVVILDLREIDANVTDFVINGPEVRTRINKLSLLTRRGVRLKNLMTDFEYTLDHMDFKNLKLSTQESELIGDLKFIYKREDLKDFTRKVKIEASFRDSRLKLKDLNSFYDEFGDRQTAQFSVDLSGTLNNLIANNLDLRTSRNTRIDGDLEFNNLFSENDEDFQLDGKLRNLSSNYYDLTALLPNILGKAIPSIFVELGNFRMVGESNIVGSDLNANFDLFTEIGFMKTDLVIERVNDIDEASYVGGVVFEEFNLGEMINDPSVGFVTGEVRLDGKGFKLESIETNVEGDILSFGYNGYTYSDLILSGELGNYVFNGKLNVEDPNLKLDFNGLADFSEAVRRFDFKADVGYANLKALNFIKNDTISEFTGRVNMAALGSSYEDLDGYISVKDVTYVNDIQTYEFDDFEIVSEFRGEDRRITVDSPDIISGEMSGQFKIK